MSSTSQVTTYSDIYTDIQNRVRVTTGITATENQAKRYANTALQDIAFGTDYKLPWLERRAVLLTHAPYTTGTVDIAVGATSVTGTTTLWNTATDYGVTNARTTGKMTVSGANDIYRVSTVTSDTALGLETRYIASAAADDATYIYFEDEYALASDFLRPVDFQMFSDDYNIRLISRRDFRMQYPRPNVSGRPRVGCIVDIGFSSSTTPVRRVQFYPYPDAVYAIPYTYITSNLAVSSAGVEASAMSSDTDEPNMPLRYRHLIVLHALYNWYRDHKDDARSQEAKAEYTDAMLRLLGDREVATHTGAQIQPRSEYYVGRAKRPWRQRGGRTMDINDAFDRFEL